MNYSLSERDEFIIPAFKTASFLLHFISDMKNILLFIFLNCPGFASLLLAQHYTDHQYVSTDSIFNNPERGFYKYTSRGSANGSLSKSTLENYYNDGYTLIYRIYYMPDFVTQSISKAYLDKIREDFQIDRKSVV